MNAASGAPIESLLTFPQAAKVLGISVRQFYRVVAEGKIPVIMVSKCSPRVQPDALRRFLDSCKEQVNGSGRRFAPGQVLDGREAEVEAGLSRCADRDAVRCGAFRLALVVGGAADPA